MWTGAALSACCVLWPCLRSVTALSVRSACCGGLGRVPSREQPLGQQAQGGLPGGGCPGGAAGGGGGGEGGGAARQKPPPALPHPTPPPALPQLALEETTQTIHRRTGAMPSWETS
jgi:hypothetical protein